MKGINFIFIFLLSCGCLTSQTDSALAGGASGKTLRKLGKSALRQNDPSSAITFFESYLKRNNTDAAAMEMLGRSYMEIRDYERAEKAFLRAYKTDPKKAPEALYYHAQMQKSNGKYDSARAGFQKFKKEYKGPEKSLKRQAAKEIGFCDSIGKLAAKKSNLLVTRLDSSINKVNAEGGAVSMDEATIIFNSVRTDKIEYVIEDDTAATIKKKLYLAGREENGDWKFKGEFDLNDAEYNTGNVCFSPDRKRIYFTRCKANMMEKMICAIYVSEKKSDGWSEPVKLPEEVNSKKYSSTMPAVTTDPVRGNEVIYFVSDRRKGRGGLDIWYTVYDKKKRIYKPAKNAGSKVNTAQNEITPFFDNGTRSLYFSSDGLGGFGGYDIFKATGDGKKWTSVENLGQPLNTGADDIYYTLALDPSEGFFASNRKGGNALKNRTCCDDIYHFKNPEYIHVDLSGTVMDMIEGTLPIANAQVDVYIKDVVTGERYFVKSTKTDSLGRYETRLEPEQDYQLVIRKKDFLGNTEDISTKGIKANTKIQRHSKVVKRPKEPVPIPDFQYEFGRAEFTKESGAILDKMLIDVMKANPEIIVQVQSHTDSKGNELFNQKLSQKRADQIVNYVVSKGIEPSRIRGIGLGESQPVAPNDKPDGSDNPEGRAKNRRTEFKIIGTLDTEDPDGVSE